MKNIAQRLLACALMSAVVIVGTVCFPADHPANLLADMGLPDSVATILPHAERYDLQIQYIYLDNPTNNMIPVCIVNCYDRHCRLIQTVSWYDGGQQASNSVYTYDANGNHLSTQTVSGQGTTVNMAAAYDEAGRQTMREIYIDGALSNRFAYAYIPMDNGQTAVEITSYDGDGAVSGFHRQILDGNNRILSDISCQEDGQQVQTSYAYDEKGRMTESLIETDRLSQRTEYMYTDAVDGSYIRTDAVYENGALQSRTEQQFDALGICIYQAEYTADGELMTETTTACFTP